jgi:hypothetical protein
MINPVVFAALETINWHPATEIYIRKDPENRSFTLLHIKQEAIIVNWQISAFERNIAKVGLEILAGCEQYGLKASAR